MKMMKKLNVVSRAEDLSLLELDAFIIIEIETSKAQEKYREKKTKKRGEDASIPNARNNVPSRSRR